MQILKLFLSKNTACSLHESVFHAKCLCQIDYSHAKKGARNDVEGHFQRAFRYAQKAFWMFKCWK